MAIVQCENGHFYDNRQHTYCPYCPVPGSKPNWHGRNIELELVDDFRFSHEPRGADGLQGGPLIAREDLVERLTARIIRSDGGAILIVGYRGVGKTSLVNAITDSAARAMRSPQNKLEPAVLVTLRFALTRYIPPADLLHQMINGIRTELVRLGLFRRLAPHLRRELDLAALRTAATLTSKGEESRTSKLGLSLAGIPYLSKLEFGGERLRRELLEAAFLPYEQCAAEQDVIRIARSLATKGSLRPPRRSVPTWLRPHRAPRRLALLFIFDELDKLEDSAERTGIEGFNELLHDLKSLLTASGATFLFVAGRGIHDAWQTDIERGDSLYESVFSHMEYVPALWGIGHQFCARLLKREPAEDIQDFTHFRNYLAFEGRGIPRRTLRALQKYVRIDHLGRATLAFDAADLRRFECTAALEACVQLARDNVSKRRAGRQDADRRDNDDLALRYMADWIIDFGHTPFGIAEILEACSHLNRLIAPRDDAAGIIPRALVDALTEGDFLETAFAVDKLQSAVLQLEGVEKWRVKEARLIQLGRGPAKRDTAFVLGDRIGGRYLVNRIISEGSLSTVYETVDQLTGKAVAVKCMTPGSFADPGVKAWVYQNERDILLRLSNPGIPKLLRADLENDPPFLAMELAKGEPLSRFLRERRRLAWDVVAAIMGKVWPVLCYIHREGIAWGDLKPSNIVLDAEEAHLIDFGAARLIADKNESKDIPVIGTPQFMAPERLAGEPPRVTSDVYAAGVLLYQMTTGVFPFVGDRMKDLLQEIRSRPLIRPGSLVEMPGQFEQAILRCLASDPTQRFQSIEELKDALPAGASADAAELIHSVITTQSYRPDRESGTRAATAAASLLLDAAVPPTGAASPERTTVYPRALDVLQPNPELSLDVIEPSRRQHLLIKGRSATIGRSSENEIRIEDIGVSRYHASLEFRDGTWYISAMNALNGLLVGGEVIRGECQLHPGSLIQIGNTKIRVDSEAAMPVISAASETAEEIV